MFYLGCKFSKTILFVWKAKKNELPKIIILYFDDFYIHFWTASMDCATNLSMPLMFALSITKKKLDISLLINRWITILTMISQNEKEDSINRRFLILNVIFIFKSKSWIKSWKLKKKWIFLQLLYFNEENWIIFEIRVIRNLS